MGKFWIRRTLRRWHSLILGGVNEKEAQCPPPELANESTEEPQIPNVEPLSLDLTTATISGISKVLPQELIDRIVAMLGNDLKSLKACSLTCKFMFVSTRHVIHRKIYLTSEKNWELLTVPERQKFTRGERQELAIRVLSWIAAHGLLPYARHLLIDIDKNFTPAILEPFNHHFQCFNQLQELSIYRLDTPGFLKSFDSFFVNFVPTVRSLHLDTPTGHTRDILDFICRFPHLDDLVLNLEKCPIPQWEWSSWRSGALPIVESVPPFRGRLKLIGVTDWHGYLLQQLISLRGKRHFRSIDFRNCGSEVKQSTVSALCGTLESVSTTWKAFAPGRGESIPNLTDATSLRSFTARVASRTVRHMYQVLPRILSTITSPSFSEFILEIESVPTTLGGACTAWCMWGRWTEFDEMFERMNIERGFRVVIRAEEVDGESNFILQFEDRFPLMAARKGIVFEIGPFPEK